MCDLGKTAVLSCCLSLTIVMSVKIVHSLFCFKMITQHLNKVLMNDVCKFKAVRVYGKVSSFHAL